MTVQCALCIVNTEQHRCTHIQFAFGQNRNQNLKRYKILTRKSCLYRSKHMHAFNVPVYNRKTCIRKFWMEHCAFIFAYSVRFRWTAIIHKIEQIFLLPIAHIMIIMVIIVIMLCGNESRILYTYDFKKKRYRSVLEQCAFEMFDIIIAACFGIEQRNIYFRINKRQNKR